METGRLWWRSALTRTGERGVDDRETAFIPTSLFPHKSEKDVAVQKKSRTPYSLEV